MNDIEIWREIDGFPFYEVSNHGRVRSYKYRKKDEPWPLILHPATDKDGHLRLILSRKGHKKNFYVHRLVATAFIPNPLKLPVVNHKDENPSNNRADNLEWCTVQENTVYNNMPIRRADPLRRPIVQMSLSGSVIRVWGCRSQIESETGFSGPNITNVCNGKRKSANGYLWAYA